MWPAIYNFGCIVTAVSCCAFAIKLADDYLDQEQDRLTGQANWTDILGIGTMFYAIFFISIAAAIHSSVSLSLFFASYIVGMFNDFKNRFPLGLTGWQESLLTLLLCLALFGWEMTFFSLSFVIAVQLIDDCIDIKIDSKSGRRNFASRLGCMECSLAALLALLFAWWLNEALFVPVLTGIVLVYGGLLRWTAVKHYV